jgi:hypothetical protein
MDYSSIHFKFMVYIARHVYMSRQYQYIRLSTQRSWHYNYDLRRDGPVQLVV